jgi:hypothetical protein
MDATVIGTQNATGLPRGGDERDTGPLVSASRQTGPVPHLDLLLEALKIALADPREHRLFQSGKLPGLFRSRFGPPAEAALFAIKEGLLETIRTEAKGRLIVEWVRATPKGVGFVHDHDSPKAVLSELKQLIGETRGGIPTWMADVRTEIARLTTQFEKRTREMIARLDELARRVDAALRRIDTAPKLADPVARLVPWGESALEYLDRRSATGAGGPCSLAELFHAVRQAVPTLTVPEFHDGLRRLADTRAVRLSSHSAFHALRTDPEYAILIGSELCSFVAR